MFFAGFAVLGGHSVVTVTVIFEARERLRQPDLQQFGIVRRQFAPPSIREVVVVDYQQGFGI